MKNLFIVLLCFLSVTAFGQSGTFSTLKAKTSFQLGTTQKVTGINGALWGADSTNAAKLASINAINIELNRRLTLLTNYINSAEAIGLVNTDDGAGVLIGIGTNIIYARSFIGANGTSVTQQDSTITIDRQILSGSATLDFPSTASGATSGLNITVTGAAVGDCVSVGFGAASFTSGMTWTAYVGVTNTVTVMFFNASGSTVDPASATFNVRVIK